MTNPADPPLEIKRVHRAMVVLAVDHDDREAKRLIREARRVAMAEQPFTDLHADARLRQGVVELGERVIAQMLAAAIST